MEGGGGEDTYKRERERERERERVSTLKKAHLINYFETFDVRILCSVELVNDEGASVIREVWYPRRKFRGGRDVGHGPRARLDQLVNLDCVHGRVPPGPTRKSRLCAWSCT